MKNVFKPLIKRVSMPLQLTAAALETDPAIHRKMFGSGCPCVLVLLTLHFALHILTLITLNK